MVNLAALRVALAENNLTQWKLATKLGYRPSTFSDYVRGARPVPRVLIRRIERALRLPPGALALEQRP
jgi:predicted transcriptional regulator